ncbi:hypothetical protein EW026_g7871 [Hermanssonia centrifuga]|uniref:C2 domain-containing protein n=1 Tax=Hermanssonia centrifuga TaxID=98765 RepID=A0A4S4K6B8_9APHY|nr:hypothetical protein EW026_g7871 [Hermanssonia centrifuga]
MPKANVAFSVTVVRASGLPKPGLFKSNKRRYYVVLTIGANVRKTSTFAKTNQPEWNEKFKFQASLNSKVFIEVYAQKGSDRNPQVTQVGSESVPVKMIIPSSPDVRHSITQEIVCKSGKRFKLDLCVKVDAPATANGQGASDPPSVESGSAGARLSQDNVDDRSATQEPLHNIVDSQLVNAEINKAKIAIPPASEPRTAAALMGAMDTGSAVVTQVHAIETTLKPVLDKLKVFCDIMDKVAEVHPYATMAWTILKGVYTVVQNQFDRDDKIVDLFMQMTSLYEIVDELQRQLDDKANPGIKSPKELLKRIAIQTVDYCFFVRSYISLPISKRTTKGIFSNIDDRITKYRTAFESLKQEFYEKLHVDTQLIVSRVLEAVEGAGM